MKVLDAVPSLKKIVHPILPYLEEVEDRLQTVASESDGILKESSAYVLDGGGKRLRSALVIFCALSTSKGVKNRDAVIELACAVELIHSATLVHDDIIDQAVLRRLKPTVNVQFGQEVALLLGDYLYSKAFRMVAKVGDPLLTEYISETTQGMCEGELDQLKHRYRADLTLEEYLSFIERKTASLISVCARAGARLAWLSKAKEDSLAEFGLNIGISYQIVDDLLDMIGSENKLGKTLRTDAGNGKMTLPAILLLKNLNPREKEQFLINFKDKKPDWGSIQPLVQKNQIAEQTLKFSDEFYLKAMESIKDFEIGFKKSLEDLSCFVLHRDY